MTDSNQSGIVQDGFGSVPTLGVGLLYNAALPDFVRSNLDAFDYLAITPDLFWLDRGPGHPDRYEELESWIETLDGVAANRPIVSHNIGLSIGNAGSLDVAYLDQIARFQDRYKFPWHSDHLSFALRSYVWRCSSWSNTGCHWLVPLQEINPGRAARRVRHKWHHLWVHLWKHLWV